LETAKAERGSKDNPRPAVVPRLGGEWCCSRSVGSPAFAVGASILDWNYDWGVGDWIPAFAGMTRFFKSLDPRSKHSGMTIGWHPAPGRRAGQSSLDDLGHHAGADRAAALADREAQALVHRHRVDQLHRHLHVVARHHHLRALRQRHRAGDVRGPEVELRAVALEERRVAAAL